MLHLIGYTWISLISAFGLGLLISYLAGLRRFQLAKPQDFNLIQGQVSAQELAALREDLEATKGDLAAAKRDLMATKSELMATRAERDLARVEFEPLYARLDAALAEIEALRETTLEKEKAIVDTQEHVRAYADALHQANTNIRTANRTIQAAQEYLQTQTKEIEHLKIKLQDQPDS